jgi:hypothetical protein
MASSQLAKMPRSSLPIGTALRPRLHDQYVWPYDADAAVSADGSVKLWSWTVQAFEWADRETGELVDMVAVQVIAPDEAAAVGKAMCAVRRQAYRIAHVTEMKTEE